MRYVSTNITRQTLFNWGFLLLALLVVSQCIAPSTNFISRYLAEHTAHIMLIFFIIGGIALLIKKPVIMLYSWLLCAGLCHFLKDATSSPFYYASTNQSENSLQVSHFELDSKTEQAELLDLNTENFGDLISIQSFSNPAFSEQLTKKLQAAFPYKHQLHYLLDKPYSIYVFSKLPLDVTDTFYYDQVPHITGFVEIDSQHKKIQFISLNIPNAKLASTSEGLKKVAEHWSYQAHQNDQPIIAFGAVQAKAWLPEVRAFRTRLILNDSRLDMSLSAEENHIFYSNHLRCTDFKTIGNGMGVRGTYQFKSHNSTVYQQTISWKEKEDILSQR